MSGYYLTIEGLGYDSDPWQFSFPTAFSPTNSVATLIQPPEGASGRFDPVQAKFTVGEFRFMLLINPATNVRLAKLQGPPVNVLARAHTAAETDLYLRRSTTVSGIVAGDVLHIDREACYVSAVSVSYVTVVRGSYGTTAGDLAKAAPVYKHCPPTFVGREVRVYDETDTLILQGVIGKEPQNNLFYSSFSVLERLGIREFGAEPEKLHLTSGGISPVTTFTSYGHSEGGYFFLPNAPDGGVVLAYAWDGVSWVRPPSLSSPIWGRFTSGQFFAADGYQILLSNADLPYCPFGWTDGVTLTRSDNPVTIALNLILSLDGTNYDVGDDRRYDLSTNLYPEYALGIERAKVDMTAFRLAESELDGIRAKWLWLGGGQPYDSLQTFADLVRLFGYAIGTKRDGTWTIVRFRDLYPQENYTDFDDSRLYDPQSWAWSGNGRSLDNIVAWCNPPPTLSEKGQFQVTNNEVNGRRLYPIGVGDQITLDRVPYDVNDLAEGLDHAVFLASTFRRLSERSVVFDSPVRIPINVGVGDRAKLTHERLWDTVTGLEQTQSQGAQIVGEKYDWFKGTSRAEFLLSGNPGKFGLICPSLKVSSALSTLYLTDTATSSPFPTTSRELSTTAPSSEVSLGPGEFDNISPGNTDAGQWNPNSAIADTTLAAEIDNVLTTIGNTRQGWLFDEDLTGVVLPASVPWIFQLRLRANQGSGLAGRICARVTIVSGSSGQWVTVKNLFTTQITGESSHSTGQTGWRDQNEARVTVTSTAADFLVTIGGASTVLGHTFVSGERILVELGFCDADSTTDRTWRLDYNNGNSFVIPPTIGVEVGTYSEGNDTDAFVIGDAIVLVDERMVAKSDITGTYPTLVQSKTATSIALDSPFKNASGIPVEVEVGDIITYSDYAEVTQTQRDSFAFSADGPINSEPDVGAGDNPYVMGD